MNAAGRPRPSVVVRAKDKVSTVRRTLVALREQTVEVEVVLVDSGSTDGTVQLAGPLCDKVVQIRPEEFSYGKALNIGALNSSGEVIFALSAHAVPPGRQWVEHALEAYEDPEVAATIGEAHGPDGSVLAASAKLKLPCPQLWGKPWWGFSNTGSSWRREVWEAMPFDERLVACEDKEWMWRVLGEGYSMVVDPRLQVGGGHRRKASAPELYRRVYLEHLALAEVIGYPPLGLAGLVSRWWSHFPYASRWPRPLRLFSPWRIAELLGEFEGDRVGSRQRGPTTITREYLDRSPSLALAPGLRQVPGAAPHNAGGAPAPVTPRAAAWL